MKKNFLVWIWPFVKRFKKLRSGFLPAWYERQLLKKYNSSNVDCPFTGIIFMHDNFFSSGGLVDRIKGVVSGYFLAKELGVDFHIYFSDVQAPMISIMNKGNVHLIYDKNQLSFSKKNSKPVVLYNYKPKSLSVLKLKMNRKKQIHLYSNIDLLYLLYKDEKSRSKVWSDMFHYLFDTTIYGCLPALGSFNSIPVGIHLRFIGLLGDFSDLRKYVLPEADKIRMLEWCCEMIHTIAAQHDAPIIVVSDSTVFLKSLIRDSSASGVIPKLIIDHASIGHTALEHAVDIFEKAVIDFSSLSTCRKVYQLRYGKMHNSDFSRYASMVNSNDFELIESDASS